MVLGARLAASERQTPSPGYQPAFLSGGSGGGGGGMSTGGGAAAGLPFGAHAGAATGLAALGGDAVLRRFRAIVSGTFLRGAAGVGSVCAALGFPGGFALCRSVGGSRPHGVHGGGGPRCRLRSHMSPTFVARVGLSLAPAVAVAQLPILDGNGTAPAAPGWAGFGDIPFIVSSLGSLLLATALAALVAFHPAPGAPSGPTVVPPARPTSAGTRAPPLRIRCRSAANVVGFATRT